jgi:hypothetical protein
MPFYFRVPLPGPFGYSARIGGRKRRRRGKSYHGELPGWRCHHNHRTKNAALECATRYAASQQKRSGRPPARLTWTGSFGDWECAHSHTAEQDARLCGLQRKLDELSDMEKETGAIDLTGASPEVRRQHAGTMARIAAMRAETLAKMRSL